MIEFRLLGPFGLWSADAELALGPARQRCVLAVLLVGGQPVGGVPGRRRQGQPMATATLIEMVWGDAAPQRAREVLYTYLSRLRRVLAPVGVVLEHRPGGYVCTVDPDAVDAHRFDRLVARGNAEPDLAARAALLRQALSLWRGEPLGGLGGDWAERTRERLRRRWLSAMLGYSDAALRLGRHATLVGELSDAVERDPVAEPLVERLMLALYRDGRRSEALAVFRRTRAALVDQQGLDPSPRLQQLHHCILSDDPALTCTDTPTATVDAARATPADTPTATVDAARATPADTPTATVDVARASPTDTPAQLPMDTGGFAGRDLELAELARVAESVDRSPVVLITGMGGVGKTALAVYWAHRVAHEFSGGQLYVNLRGYDPGGRTVSAAEAVLGFLDALGVAPQRVPATVDVQVGLYRSLLSGRRVLVIVDNARDVDQVRPLLPGSPGCMAVVTSRDQMSSLVAAQAAHLIDLGPLGAADAQLLLQRRLGRSRVAAEPHAAGDFIARCAGLPLALAIVAARGAARPRLPLDLLAAELAASSGSLEAFADTDPTTDLRTVLSWSYNTLTPAAARLFRLLGLHRGPDISAAAVASLAGLPPPKTRPLLAELTRAHLLTERAPHRYVLHDLLLAYAGELANTHDATSERRAAVHRILDHYLHTAHAAALLLSPQRDPLILTSPRPDVTPEDLSDKDRALAWFTTEHRVLLAAVAQAAATGFHTHAGQLAWAMADYLDWRGHPQDLVTTQRVAMQAAQRLSDQPGQASAYRLRAHGLARLGRFDQALADLASALGLYHVLDDRRGTAHTHLNISSIAAHYGDNDRALRHARQAHALYQALGDKIWQARSLNDIGWAQTLLGDHQQAITHCEQALSLFESLEDRHGQANAYDSLGHAYHRLGRHDQAIACYQRALALFREAGDRHYEAEVLDRIADTHHSAGNQPDARQARQDALNILHQLDHPDVERVRARLESHAATSEPGPTPRPT